VVKNLVVECHLGQTTISSFGRMLETLTQAGFQISVNSYGDWRDLTRQTPVEASHWEQYLLVAAWRGTISGAWTEPTRIPYAGAPQLIREKLCQATVRKLEEAIHGQLLTGVQNYQVLPLSSEFLPEGKFGWLTSIEQLPVPGDSLSNPSCSTVMLFEDGHLLGPSHSLHIDIRCLGQGRYSHWDNNLYFSTSDGSDPNSNGRKYSLMFEAS
jgi:hypothetical protein